LADSLEQQAALARILQSIAASSTDAQPVLHAVLHSGMGLTHGEWALVLIREDRYLRYAAIAGLPDAIRPAIGKCIPRDRRSTPVVAYVERRTIHITDRSAPAVLVEFPDNLHREPTSASPTASGQAHGA
jgi:hypothetical protein